MRNDLGDVLCEGPTDWASASMGLVKNPGCISRIGCGMLERIVDKIRMGPVVVVLVVWVMEVVAGLWWVWHWPTRLGGYRFWGGVVLWCRLVGVLVAVVVLGRMGFA